MSFEKEEMYFNKFNWDNKFSLRFKLENGESLIHIPNNIFLVELPAILATDFNEPEVNKILRVTLRSTVDGNVTKEVYDKLFRTSFDVELSLANNNKVEYEYNGCSIHGIEFAPLMQRPKANPYNFTVCIKVSQVKFNGLDTQLVLGTLPTITHFDPTTKEQ